MKPYQSDGLEPLACWSRTAALTATLFTAPLVFAQQPPVQTTETVVITATRIKQPLAEVLSDVVVIHAEDIASADGQSLPELLRGKAGLEFASNGGLGQTSGLFLRGTNSNHVLVLVDGVRIGSATTGATALEHLPLAQIDRIEVLRGPGSSLYGTDAIGGVIQIFTKQGEDAPRINASAGVGSYGTRTLTTSAADQFGQTRLSVRGGYLESDGYSATNPGAGFSYNPDADPYRNRNLSAHVSHAIGTHTELGASAFTARATTHFDAGVGSDNVSRQSLSAYSAYSRNRFLPSWESLLRVSRGTDAYSSAGSYSSRFRTDQDQAVWQNEIAVGGGKLIAGLDYLEQKVDSDTAFTQTRRTVRSAFAGYLAEFDRHGLQLNARSDDNSQFGQHDSGSAAYSYRFATNWRVIAATGSAFKAPNFNDLYYPLSFGYSGNPDLKPERAFNREAAIAHDAAGRRFRLTWFDNRVHDLISSNATFTTVENVSRARIRGATLSYQMNLGGYSAGAELTSQSPKNETTGKLLPRRARQHGSVTLSRAFGLWSFGGELVGASHRFDTADNSTASRMGGYGLLNLTTRYALTKDWGLQLRWNNVFDKQYELTRGYNTPGSNVFLTLQYQSMRF